MSLYGECLRKYIEESGMSVSRLAKETGFNRTLLQKYLSGDRLPKTVQESCQLAEALMLSPEKQEELLEQYNRSRYGIRQYDGFLMIRDIVRGLVDYRMQPAYVRESARQSVSPISGEVAGGSGARTAEGAMDALSAREPSLAGFTGSRVCTGSMEVENALRAMLRAQVASDGSQSSDAQSGAPVDAMQLCDKGKIQIISQPEAGSLLKTVLSVCAGHNVKVEQIVCLDGDSQEGNNNIRTVYNLIPMLFGSVDYENFYYYDKKDAHINSMSLLPILILTDTAAMVCSYRMDEGLLFTNEESVRFCRSQYQRIKSRTSPLTRRFRDDITEWSTFMRTFMTDLVVAEIYINPTPCITYGLDEEILSEVLCLGEEGNQYLLDIFAKNKDTFLGASNKKTSINLFEEAGLRRFMETGRSDEYPSGWYTPIPALSCLRILEGMIALAETGHMRYIMTNPDRLPLDPDLLIYVGESVVFQYHQDSHLSSYFTVNERGVRRSFREFIPFAQENGWISTGAETIRRMKELLEEYAKKWQ